MSFFDNSILTPGNNIDFVYPIAFNFKNPQTGVKLLLDIYNSGENDSRIIASAAGGLTFDIAALPTLFSYTGYFPNGKYFGKITYTNYNATLPDGQPNPELLTQVKWEKQIFTGYESEGFLTAKIVRNGFNETPLGIQVSGSLLANQGLP